MDGKTVIAGTEVVVFLTKSETIPRNLVKVTHPEISWKVFLKLF